VYVNVSPQWVAGHIGLVQGLCLAPVALMLGVSCCCSHIAREYPKNYIFLFTLTVLLSFTIGFTCMMYTGASVLIAAGTTCVVFFALTAYACMTKTDFTGMGPYLMAALMCLMGFSFVMWLYGLFAPLPAGMRIVYAFLGVLLFSFYIVYDTQLIVGGSHKQHQFDIDDYAFAALNLYLDIINLFISILQLLGDRE